MRHVVVATEDELSEAVVKRLLFEVGHPADAIQSCRKSGNGYLRARMKSWCEIARQQPVFLLTDLDTQVCPAKLVEKWLGKLDCPENLLFRVAVREVESWLLADHVGMARLMGSRAKLHDLPDTLIDPKQSLLRLAKSASRDVRADLIKEKGAVAGQGIGYNSRLSDFVQNTWNPVGASTRSPSLKRARQRIRELIVGL